MIAIRLAACAGMIAGIFLLLGLSFREFTDGVFYRLLHPPGSLRDEINEATDRKKPGIFRRQLLEAQSALEASGRMERFPMVCAVSMLLLIVGAAAAILFGNAFLVPVLAVGLMLVPFWYIRLTAGSFKKEVAAELETALSVVTTAYLRTENFQMAVEENVRYLNQPVQGVFQRFLTRIKHIDPNMDAALTELKAAIDNEVWQEWCDGVFSPRKEFITMAVLVLGNIPLVRFINADWYATLTKTVPGQAVIALCIAAVFVSFAFVIKLTQPIEYRR